MPVNLEPQQFVNSVLGLIDHKTRMPIPATFSNIKFLIDNTAVATVDDIGKILAISEGIANMTVSADVSYVNNLGSTITEHKTCHLWNYSQNVV